MRKILFPIPENGGVWTEDIILLGFFHDENEKKPEFPESEVPDPESRAEKVADCLDDNPKKTYEKRARTVRTSGSSSDNEPYLRNYYTNSDGEMVCQICEEKMPFKKRSGVFYFEDSRIRRDVSNMANRMANCDIANLKKTSKTAYIHKLAIQKIRENNQFDKLTLRLQTMVLLREEYPDASYEELAEYSDKLFGHSLSKSGISHCMTDLVNFSKRFDDKNISSKE